MKICLSTDSYPTKDQPFSSFIASLAEEFTKLGHEVTVIAPQSITRSLFRNKQNLLPYHSENKTNFGSIKIYRPKTITFGNKSFLGYITHKSNQISVCRCYRNLNKDFDLIYAHFWACGYNILPCAISNKIPFYVATGEDTISLTKWISRKNITKLRKSINGVICVSTKNMNESIKRGLTTQKKCIILPNGVDLQKFKRIEKTEARKRLNFNNNDFIVAFCGRFVHRKGSKRLSDAITLLNDKSIKSIFIGSSIADVGDSYIPDCEGILYKGKLKHEEVPLYLNSADVYVLPTLAEGCSNSIVEALACGLPIISSNLDFNLDILDNNNAILIDPMNINEIADAIKLLKEDSDLQKKMSDAAYLSAKRLDYSERVKKILNFISKTKK